MPGISVSISEPSIRVGGFPKRRFLPYNPRLFAVYGVFPNGGDSTGARWREQAAVLSRRCGGFAQARAGEIHRAGGVLRPQGARGGGGVAGDNGGGEGWQR